MLIMRPIAKVYAKNPLEDGEVDKIRENAFTKCLRKEERANKKGKKIR